MNLECVTALLGGKENAVKKVVATQLSDNIATYIMLSLMSITPCVCSCVPSSMPK